MQIEVIFMTYSYVHRMINSEAFPHAPELYSKEYMVGRGRGKYWYRQSIRDEGELFLKAQIEKRFPDNKIVYFSFHFKKVTKSKDSINQKQFTCKYIIHFL
jgi:spore photoproduct lyase